ncbi:MAG: hypothetical protein AB2693_19270 [Candidatus Thiodiazotropha sp.]
MGFLYCVTYGSPQTWSAQNLDTILEQGDMLYERISNKRKQTYLMIDELPHELNNFDVKYLDAITGSLSFSTKLDISSPFRTLRAACDDVLPNSGMAFMTIGNMSPSYTTGIVREGDKFLVFDPHSRNTDGMCCPDGTAVVTCHQGLDDLIKFYRNLARSLAITDQHCPFELVPVKILKKEESSESEDRSSFSGFSDIETLEINNQSKSSLSLNTEEKLLGSSLFSDSDSDWTEPLIQVRNKMRRLSKNIEIVDKNVHSNAKDKEDSVKSGSEMSDDMDSSGSEYQFTKYEKKLMSSQVSSSDLDSSESSPSQISTDSKMSKKGQKIHRIRTNKTTKSTLNPKSDYVSKEHTNKTKQTKMKKAPQKRSPKLKIKIKRHARKFQPVKKQKRGPLSQQLLDMRKTKLEKGDKYVVDEVLAQQVSSNEQINLNGEDLAQNTNPETYQYGDMMTNFEVKYGEHTTCTASTRAETNQEVPYVSTGTEREQQVKYDKGQTETIRKDKQINLESQHNEDHKPNINISEEIYQAAQAPVTPTDSEVEVGYSKLKSPIAQLDKEVEYGDGNYQQTSVDPELDQGIIYEQQPVQQSSIMATGNDQVNCNNVDQVVKCSENQSQKLKADTEWDKRGQYADGMSPKVSTGEEFDQNEDWQTISSDITTHHKENVCAEQNWGLENGGQAQEITADERKAEQDSLGKNLYKGSGSDHEQMQDIWLDKQSEAIRIEANRQDETIWPQDSLKQDVWMAEVFEEQDEAAWGNESLILGDPIDPDILDTTQQSTVSINDSLSSSDNHIIDCEKQKLKDIDTNIAETPKRGRKRSRDESSWVRNVRKRLKNTGQSYVGRKGQVKAAKVMKKGCGEKCKFQCHKKFSQEEREDIFHHYWALGDLTRQRDFVLKFCRAKEKGVTKIKGPSRKTRSLTWTLPLNGQPERVCKIFFIHTLAISDRIVFTALEKQTLGMSSLDGRGKHLSRPTKTSEEQLDSIKAHINSFPCVESHYCRKDSHKQYLQPGLSVPKMYNLYLEICKNENKEPVQLPIYRRVFDYEFNLSFHRPLKDQCDLCNSFNNSTEAEKSEMKEEYENHISNKELARNHKNSDKETALKDPGTSEFIAACFDLEEVLMTPKSFQSSLYYKRRLNTFNLSIYDLGSKDGFCYVWNEAIAQRGGCEIASCVYSFLKTKHESGKKQVVLYSDNCSGQNKNKYYTTMLWYALNKFSLTSIEQKYLEKGHTQNQNDSIHATIECCSKPLSIYTTAGWAATIRAARPKQPYIVKEMGLADFFNFGEVCDMLKNFDLDTDRKKIYWSGVRRFKLTSQNPNIIEFQYNYDGPTHKLNLVQRLRRFQEISDPLTIVLSQLREDFPKISMQKFNDLISLCKDRTIPAVHHAFYVLLPHETHC